MKQTLLLKFIFVFVYQGITAVLPLVFAMMSENPSWVALIPILRACWQTLEKYITDQGLIGATADKQVEVWH